MPTPTRMAREIAEIPEAAARLLSAGRDTRIEAAARARAHDPAFLITVARGSSDHAATYLKYACELLLGLPVASVGPSVASVYGAELKLKRALSLTISQSGQSPDIVAMTQSAGRDGALTLALTNDPASPLADSAALTLALHAGPELSVAATKTFLNSVVAGLAFLAEWADDTALKTALAELPTHLAAAVQHDWPALRAALDNRNSLFTLGRGPAWAIAGEAALKLKETCQLHGEAYSSAEVMHGPVSIINEGFPVLGFGVEDAAETGLAKIADQISDMGGRVFVSSGKAHHAHRLEHIRTGHPLTDPLPLIVSFYAMVERLAVARNINPDMPRHLKKVTETV